MTLEDYFEEIESLQFQIQFSVLSGMNILLRALSQHSTVSGLVTFAENHPDYAQQIFNRIHYLLPIAETETKLSYDESVVTYLYCLSQLNLSLAQRASIQILQDKRLWWSTQLAQQLIKEQSNAIPEVIQED